MTTATDTAWQHRSEFRASLPALKEAQETRLRQDIMSYRQFYRLEFNVPHQHFMGRFQSGPFALVGQIFRPEAPRGTLFIYHGYFDHLGLYRFPIELGLKLGFAVVGFDLPGHGISSGPLASIDCFSRYAQAQAAFIRDLPQDLCCKPWFALGQSTGAAVILDSLWNNKDPRAPFYDGAILLAPLVRVKNWYWVRLMYHLLKHRGGTPRTFRNNAHDQSFITFLKEVDPFQHRRIEADWVGAMIQYTKRIIRMPRLSFPTLVIQGDQDDTVDHRYNLSKLEEIIENPRFMLLQGAHHHLVNESSEYLVQIEAAVARFLEECLNFQLEASA